MLGMVLMLVIPIHPPPHPTPNFTNKACISNQLGILLQKEKIKASSLLGDKFTGNIHLDEVILTRSTISIRDQRPNTFLVEKIGF